MLAVLGTTNWDVFFTSEALPPEGGNCLVERQFDAPGGGPSNTAAWLAAQDAEVVFATGLSEEPESERYRRACAELGLELHEVRVPRLSRAYIVLPPSRERTIFYTAPEPWPAAALPGVHQLLAGSDWLWTDLADGELEALYESFPASRGIGRGRLEGEAAAGRTWSLAVGSLDEDSLPAAELLDAVGLQHCVMTAGALGGMYWERGERGGEWQHYQATSAGALADTTGAGDAFLAGLLLGLSRGEPLPEAVKHGSAVAAAAVSQHGGWPLVRHEAGVV